MPTALPDGVILEPGNGGLDRVRVETARATGEVYHHGAHVTEWRPSGRAPVLWVSRASQFKADAPIRGGVPICFPWFGAHATNPGAPAHGFARISRWELADAANDDGRVELRFVWSGENSDRRLWPHAFAADYRVSLGERLSLALDVANSGDAPFRFEAALHTYFAVGDIRKVTVTGLEGTEYLDKVEGFARKRQDQAPIAFTSETDRVYLDTEATCRIHDPVFDRRIVVANAGSLSTVVWNPWINKARAMPDFGDDEWPEMLCIETANVGDRAVQLEPGSHHTMRADISVE